MPQYRWDEEKRKFKVDEGREFGENPPLSIPYGRFQKNPLYILLDTEYNHWREGRSPLGKEKAHSSFKELLYSYGIKQIREKRLHRDIESNRCPSPTLTVREINDGIPRPKPKFNCPETDSIKNNILKILKEGKKKYSAPEIINRVCNKNKNKYSPHLVGYVLWKMTEGRLLDSVEER